MQKKPRPRDHFPDSYDRGPSGQHLGPQVLPMLSREVVVGQQWFAVRRSASDLAQGSGATRTRTERVELPGDSLGAPGGGTAPPAVD